MSHMSDDHEIQEVAELRSGLESLDAVLAERPLLRSMTGFPIMTRAFFPGGNGLSEGIDANSFPVSGILILGSNFGCYSKFVDDQRNLRLLDETSGPTWTPLLQDLRDSGIDNRNCFFTNAWPFLHEGKSNLGPVDRWLKDATLMAKCISFFETTLTLMRPRLIVALGTRSAAFLSHVWPAELGLWRANKVRALDVPPMATVRYSGVTAVCVARTHPSMHNMDNAKYRKSQYQHRAGEVRLVTEARLHSEMPGR